MGKGPRGRPFEAGKADPRVSKPFTGKDDPRNGRGCKRGAPNAGRPRNEYVDLCAGMLADPKVLAAVGRVLKNDKHPHFAAIYRAVSDRAYGKPVQPISGPDGTTPAAIAIQLVKP